MKITADQQPPLRLKRVTLFLTILGLVLIPAIIYRSILTTPTDMALHQQKYAQSQYILGDSSPQKISDEELYIYAGYGYVNGEDPTTINFEHPPLVKYLFGLSYLLFQNSHILSVLVYAVFLWIFYEFTGILLKNHWVRIGSLVVLGTLPVIYVLAKQVLLDLSFSMSILALFVVAHRNFTNTWLKYGLLGLILGAVASIKYPIPFIFVPSFFLVIIAWRAKEIKKALIIPVVAGIFYLLQYVMYFAHGHSLIDLIAFEKYRFSWWTGERTMPKFLIFSSLFFGQFQGWWDGAGIVKNQEWTVAVPGIFLTQIAIIPWLKRNFWTIICFAYSSCVLLLFAIGSAAEVRYLTQLIPFWIILIASVLEKTISIYAKKSSK